MKSLYQSISNRILFSFLIGFIVLHSCSKHNDRKEAAADRLQYHISNNTRADEIQTYGFFITQEMVMRFLLGHDGYKDSIRSVLSYPSETNPLLYVVNFVDGWKVFPSDSRFGVVIAESDEGAIDLSKEIVNENFKVWIGDVVKQIEGARSVPDSFGEESVLFWNSFRAMNNDSFIEGAKSGLTRSLAPGEPIWGKVLVSTSSSMTVIENKDHLLQTKWGQGAPWNQSLPVVDSLSCLAGCAAVAISQVLYYFHYLNGVPSGLYHSLSLTQYVSNEPFDLYDQYGIHHVGYYRKGALDRSNPVENSPLWAQMPLLSYGGTDLQYRYVSDLLLDVGVRLETHYSPWRSIVFENYLGYYDFSPLFSSISQKQFQGTADVQIVMSNLDLNSPTIITSQGFKGEEQVGHAWVIDGYQIQRYHNTFYYAWYPFSEIEDDAIVVSFMNEDDLLSIYPNLYAGMIVPTYSQVDADFFRMNWGWNGVSDNYLCSTSASVAWLNVYSFDKFIYYNLVPRALIIQY